MSILAVNVLAVNRPLPLYIVSTKCLLTLHVVFSTRSPCFSRSQLCDAADLPAAMQLQRQFHRRQMVRPAPAALLLETLGLSTRSRTLVWSVMYSLAKL